MTDTLPVIAPETALIDTPALIDAPILATSQEESDGTTHAACKPAQDGIDSPATQQSESGGQVASQQGVDPAQLKSVPLKEDACLEENLARPAEALAKNDVALDESEQLVEQSNATFTDESNDACKRSSPVASTAEQAAPAPGPTQSQQGRERLTSDVYAGNPQSQSHAAETRRQQEHSWAYYCSHLQQHHQYLQHDQSYDYRRYQQHMNAAVPLPAGSYYAKRNLQGLDQRFMQGPLAMNYSDVSSFESYPLAPRDMNAHDATFSQHLLPQPYPHGGFFQAPLPQYGSYYYSGQPDPRDYAGPGGHYARPMALGDNKSYDHGGGPSRASRFEPGLPSPGLSRHPRGQLTNNMPLGALGNVPTSTPAPLYSMLNTGLVGSNASSSLPLSRNKHVFDQADQMARERMELTSSASAPAWLGQTHSTSHGLHSEALGSETAHHGDEANSTHVDPTALCFTPPVKPRLSNSPTSHEDRSLSKDTVTAESPTSSLEQPRVSGGASHASSTQAGQEPRPVEMESSQRDARGEDELSSQETTPDDPDNDSDYDPRAEVSPRRRKVARQTRQTAYSMPAAPRRGRMPGNEKEHGLLNPVESHERYMHDNMQMMASQQHGPFMAPPNVGGMLMGHPSYRYQPHHFQGPMMLPIQPLGSSQPLPFHQPIQPGPGVEYSEDDLTLVSRHRSKKRKRKTIVPAPPPVAKAFLCDAQGCGKRFRRSEHLKRHIRSLHTGEKPFPCATCGKTFSRTDNLSQHMRVHQPEARQIETKRKRKSRSG